MSFKMKLKKVWSEQVALLYQFLASVIIMDIFIAMIDLSRIPDQW